MAYKGFLRFNARCPKHIRFNPDVQGRGAIKAGCTTCEKLMDLREAVLKARGLSKELGPVSRADVYMHPRQLKVVAKAAAEAIIAYEQGETVSLETLV